MRFRLTERLRRQPVLFAVLVAVAAFNLVAMVEGPPTWPLMREYPGPVIATPGPMPQAGREFTVASSATLLRVYERAEYSLTPIRSGERGVPRLYLAALPPDLDDLASVDARKRLFLKIVLPLVLRVNREIEIERTRATALADRLDAGERLSAGDREWLVRVAIRYGVLDQEDAEAEEALGAGERESLRRRVNGVPPSLALAQAVVESGWGRSRFAREGNALFGQWTWDKEQGIEPAAARDADHAVREFASLVQSVRAYMHNLNTHRSYREFRRARARGAGARELARTLTRYSERGAVYGEELVEIIAQNDLGDFDAARLGPTTIRPSGGWGELPSPVPGS